MPTYDEFLDRKTQLGGDHGFSPSALPDFLYPFQESLVRWALLKGRGAIFADCGLGKTPMQLVWADQVVCQTQKPVLILAPLAVGPQTEGEAAKFDIEAYQSRDGTVRPPITITNYEQLDKFLPEDFAGVVCDESSILKSYSGATQKSVTRFMAKIPLRLLCTATAAPNDYTELGTSSEALGGLGYSDMVGRFFQQIGSKKSRINDVKLVRDRHKSHYQRLAYRVSQQMGGYRMKGHAEEHFWRWVCSWARACRMPADLGFDDGPFILPPLIEKHHTLTPTTAPDGQLFTLPVFGLQEERQERRRTIQERCALVAGLVDHTEPAVVWCHLNDEGDLLEHLIPGSVQVKGAQDDAAKLERYDAFANGQARVMIIKPKIGAWGLNWQHCRHVVTFVSHSYEQYYQSVRRCWRFGQTSPVTVDIVSTDGEAYVADNMQRKAKAADIMFDRLVACMNNALTLSAAEGTTVVEVPSWLS